MPRWPGSARRESQSRESRLSSQRRKNQQWRFRRRTRTRCRQALPPACSRQRQALSSASPSPAVARSNQGTRSGARLGPEIARAQVANGMTPRTSNARCQHVADGFVRKGRNRRNIQRDRQEWRLTPTGQSRRRPKSGSCRTGLLLDMKQSGRRPCRRSPTRRARVREGVVRQRAPFCRSLRSVLRKASASSVATPDEEDLGSGQRSRLKQRGSSAARSRVCFKPLLGGGPLAWRLPRSRASDASSASHSPATLQLRWQTHTNQKSAQLVLEFGHHRHQLLVNLLEKLISSHIVRPCVYDFGPRHNSCRNFGAK